MQTLTYVGGLLAIVGGITGIAVVVAVFFRSSLQEKASEAARNAIAIYDAENAALTLKVTNISNAERQCNERVQHLNGKITVLESIVSGAAAIETLGHMIDRRFAQLDERFQQLLERNAPD